jgi:hypothetical protein
MVINNNNSIHTYIYSYLISYIIIIFFYIMSSVISQLLSVPPFFCGAMATIIVAICSDRKRTRGPFIIAFSFVGIIGYILLTIGIKSRYIYLEYIGACIIGAGVFPSATTSITW